MTLYYQMVFGLLVSEMVTFVLLVLPLPMKMRKGFLSWISKSPLVARIAYFVKIIFAFVLILFVDSVNRMLKAEAEASHEHHDSRVESQLLARKFYAQRNMYLTGFTLFLSLILSRTHTLILDLLTNEEKMTIVQKQAENQTKEYLRLTTEGDETKKKIEALEVQLKEAKVKVLDMETFKKQADQQSKAYMELADRYNDLEKRTNLRESENGKDK